MRKRTFIPLTLLIFSLSLNSCTQKTQNEKVSIAVASSLRFAADDLINAFGVNKCNLVFGASGMLTSQVKQGAPFQLFIPADPSYLQYLLKSPDIKIQSYKEKFVSGKIVVWSKYSKTKDIEKLLSRGDQKIAIPNPKIAPYGKAAIQYFENSDIMDSIRTRLVYGESVSQVNQFILSGSVDIAVTARSSVAFLEKKAEGHWIEVDENLYEAIVHSILLLEHNNSSGKAGRLYNFLLSDTAGSILSNFGYRTID